MHEAITSFVHDIAGISIDIMELLSIGIILFTTVQAFVKLLKKDPNARIYLLHGQSIGLTFKLGSEILRTVTVRNMDEILQIAMLIVIKAAMTWLIHWELTDTDEEPDEPSSHAAHAHLEGVFGHARPNTTIIIEAGQNAHVETARPDDVDVQHRQRN